MSIARVLTSVIILIASACFAQPTTERPKPDRVGAIGVNLDALPADVASAIGVPDRSVVIRSVRPGSPAERAGVQVADVVLAANRHPIRSPAELFEAIGWTKIGETIVLTIRRKTGTVNISVEVEELARK